MGFRAGPKLTQDHSQPTLDYLNGPFDPEKTVSFVVGS